MTDAKWKGQKKAQRIPSKIHETWILFKCIALIFSITIISSCQERSNKVDATQISVEELKNVSEEKWNKLKSKRIFFGHQSVGRDIIKGLNEIFEELPAAQIPIAQGKSISENTRHGLLHAEIGDNYKPKDKINDFSSIITDSLHDSIDIALMKLCFVDIEKSANVDELFNYYENTLDSLQTKYPQITFLHITTPLMSRSRGLKASINRILGRMDEDDHNLKRNEYNKKLREKYGPKGLVFDLALSESTYPDGTVNEFSKNKNSFSALINEYTYDGGHLNETGRRKVAKDFLLTLLKL